MKILVSSKIMRTKPEGRWLEVLLAILVVLLGLLMIYFY